MVSVGLLKYPKFLAIDTLRNVLKVTEFEPWNEQNSYIRS